MKAIIINATALNSSGALTILKQFVSAIPNDENNYILFVSPDISIFCEQPNVSFVPISVKSFFRRFYWDAIGVRKWLRKHHIEPVATLSLQNTNFRTRKSIPNFIYFHQSIPFFEKWWNPLRPAERRLWFYKSIYPFFVRLFLNDNTEIFVQTRSIQNDFSRKFDFPKTKIHVIFPDLNIPSGKDGNSVCLDSSRIHLFYPATPFIYKNHQVLFDALRQLDGDCRQKLVLHLTCQKNDILCSSSVLPDDLSVNYMGKISFRQMIGMYREADLLVFPSYIETIGLPLIEAASFGLGILVSDLPYAREVLAGYEGAVFINYKNAASWATGIRHAVAHRKRYSGFVSVQTSSWNDLFNMLKSKL